VASLTDCVEERMVAMEREDVRRCAELQEQVMEMLRKIHRLELQRRGETEERMCKLLDVEQNLANLVFQISGALGDEPTQSIDGS